MSKQKQEAVNSDSASKKPGVFPVIVAGRSDRENEHLIKRLEKAKSSFRQPRLAALSKVVNKAFTGWTIKTQKQE